MLYNLLLHLRATSNTRAIARARVNVVKMTNQAKEVRGALHARFHRVSKI